LIKEKIFSLRSIKEKIPLPYIELLARLIDKAFEKKKKIIFFPQRYERQLLQILANLEETRKGLEKSSSETIDKLREIPEFKALSELAQRVTNYFLIVVEGKIGIAHRDSLPQVLKDFEKQETRDLRGIFPLCQASTYLSFREIPKPIPKSIKEVLDKLDIDLRSLVNLATHIEKLYNDGEIAQAEEIKRRVWVRYGEFGVKFCNLWRQYLKNLIKSLLGEEPSRINKKIRLFVKDETQGVFFVNRFMDHQDLDKICNGIREAMERGEKYVAVHGLRGAAELARYVASEIDKLNVAEVYDSLTIDQKPEFSKIWYTQRGREILKYFRPF
jgi:hypothetical protein